MQREVASLHEAQQSRDPPQTRLPEELVFGAGDADCSTAGVDLPGVAFGGPQIKHAVGTIEPGVGSFPGGAVGPLTQ